jgi:hypothetical protein
VRQTQSSVPLLVSLLVLCLGCGDATAPALESPPPPSTPTPPPPTPMTGFIWGQVLDKSGLCIRGGMVEIVAGPGTGRKTGQPDDCGAWDYTGFEFSDLPYRATVTLRASAPGFSPQDREVVALNDGGPVQFVLETD